jgi:hypothetical protein
MTAYWYYEDIKGVQGASGCTKSDVVKRKFEDQEDTERAPDADTADSTAATAATPPDAGAAAAFGGEEPPPASSPGGKSLGGGSKGRAGEVSNKDAAKAQGL